MVELDEIDYGILQLLQRDARNTTPVDMADQLPVSAQTIRNRISGLQDNDVIEGYVPIINYENAGFPIRLGSSARRPSRSGATSRRRRLRSPTSSTSRRS
ncbi:Lrp/AsnC family transcriptional regulator [Halosimplex aquaticum]